MASTNLYSVEAINIPPNDPNTDVWATVRYPGAAAGPDAAIAPGTTKFPLVLYLHGNHGTVISGSSHVCGGSGPPVPNHDGYNYVLDRLASLGFIAVSINANDLNCKADRIPERGKLILEHLRRWKNWNDPGQPDADFGGRFTTASTSTGSAWPAIHAAGKPSFPPISKTRTPGWGSASRRSIRSPRWTFTG